MGKRWWGAAAVIGCALWAVSCGDESGGFSLVDKGLPEVQGYGAVWSFGADDVYVTADGGRVLHYDGSRWEEIQLDTQVVMQGIWGFAPDDIWMVGDDQLARFDGEQWTVEDLGAAAPGTEGLRAIWGSSPDDVWVVGYQSTASHWDGTQWTRYIAAGTENVGVWGSGPDDVYVVGTFDVAHWDGTEFTTLELDIFSASGVWGAASDDVWLADDGEMAHFDGSDWTVTELDVLGGPTAIWGRASNDIWGVGQFGSVMHYDGKRWNQVSQQKIGSPYLRTYFGLHGSDDGDIWVVGSEAGANGLQPLLLHR